jgi:hypothetical protein
LPNFLQEDQPSGFPYTKRGGVVGGCKGPGFAGAYIFAGALSQDWESERRALGPGIEGKKRERMRLVAGFTGGSVGAAVVAELRQTNEFRVGSRGREKEKKKKRRKRRGEGRRIQDEGWFRGPRVEGEGPAAATATAAAAAAESRVRWGMMMIVGQACHWVYDRINRMSEEEAYFPRLQGLRLV